MKKLEKVSVNQILKIKDAPAINIEVDILYKEIFTLSDIKEQLDLLKHIMAFANSNGGYIIYGVNSNNEWVGLDERSDEKIINDEFINLFKKFFSKKIEIAFNLIEIEKNFYFIIHVEPNNEHTVFFKADGTYKIKNWGNNKEKEVTVFKKDQSFYRKNTETVFMDNVYIKTNPNDILNLVDTIIDEPVIEKLDVAQSETINVFNEEIVIPKPMNLPTAINKKIEKIVTLEKLAIDAQDDLKVLLQANVNLHENIELVNQEVEKQEQELKSKEYSVFKFNEELAQIEVISNKNRELEAEFYAIMDVKMKSIYDKEFSVKESEMLESHKEAITNIYTNLTHQFQYNWEKQINEICNNLVNEINENNRNIAELKDDLKHVDLDEVQELKHRLKIVNKELDILNSKALKMSMTHDKVENLNKQIENLRKEVDQETKDYVDGLISSQFNKVQEKVKETQQTQETTDIVENKTTKNIKFEDLNVDLCVS